MQEIEKFDLLNDELTGSTLLEASAGTGKTYSVAMLALRLIIEKGYSVSEILLVTFTNAATAEMKERLRQFILQAYKISKGDKSEDDDENIIKILNNNQFSEEAIIRLKKAKDELDELQVYTIHSFLSQSIQEFAFETGMRFNYELIENQSDYVKEAVKTFWRKNITPLPKEVLTPIINRNKQKGVGSSSPAFTFNLLTSIVNDLLKGKSLPESYYSETTIDSRNWFEIIEEKNKLFWEEKVKNEREIIFDSTSLNDLAPEVYGIDDRTALKNYNANPHNYFNTLLTGKYKWHQSCREKYGPLNLERISNLLDYYDYDLRTEYLTHPFGQVYIINSIGYQCYQFVKQELKKLKEENNIKHTDELVNDFYEITKDEHKLPVVKEVLSSRYKAFFIDEFQDTDVKQSAIFTKLFDQETVQYFVGDPKQSIYGFRGADIDSYVKFKTENEHLKLRSLPINYRSTKGFVDECNSYFKRSNFSFKKEGLEYLEVDTKSSSTEGQLSVLTSDNEFEGLQKLVLHLLSKKEELEEGEQTKVLPENIAILTRGGKKAKLAKQKMAEINVPAVVLADQNIFETQEAGNMRLFCELLINRKIKDLRRLLLSNWFNSSTLEIKNWNIDEASNKLMEVYQVYEKKGFYAAFLKFYEVFQLAIRISKNQFNDRVETNTNQLLEIVYTWIIQEKLSLYSVVKRITDMAENGDKEYEEQIESDLPSVKIMTIHKSKGLEFPIVICPDFPKEKHMAQLSPCYDFKYNGKSYFVSNAFNDGEGGLIKRKFDSTQKEENTRLEYVAVTRAKHSFYGIVKQNEQAYFNGFIQDLTSELEQFDVKDRDCHYVPNTEPTSNNRSELDHSKIDKKTAFLVSSYSDLSLSEHRHYEIGIIQEDGYNQFIFNQLKKGADAGNLIHKMFEIHDFDNGDISKTLEIINTKYPSYLINDENLNFFNEFMQNVLEAKIPEMDGFTLSQLSNDKRICEMAFHWKADGFNKKDVEELLKDDEVRIKYDFDNKTGYIKGFIDFIFEHKEKYYILDWKSNHIGSTLDDYTQDKMNVAMKSNNYHLQHYIYKEAFMAYLKSIYPKKPQEEIENMWGGVIYSFVRGCRKGEESGMFVH